MNGKTKRRKPKSKMFFVRLSEAEHHLLFKLATERDVSASQLLRQALKREAAQPV